MYNGQGIVLGDNSRIIWFMTQARGSSRLRDRTKHLLDIPGAIVDHPHPSDASVVTSVLLLRYCWLVNGVGVLWVRRLPRGFVNLNSQRCMYHHPTLHCCCTTPLDCLTLKGNTQRCSIDLSGYYNFFPACYAFYEGQWTNSNQNQNLQFNAPVHAQDLQG